MTPEPNQQKQSSSQQSEIKRYTKIFNDLTDAKNSSLCGGDEDFEILLGIIDKKIRELEGG